VCICSVLLLSFSDGRMDNTTTSLNLRGRVKSLREYEKYTGKSPDNKKDSTVLYRETDFDQKGKISVRLIMNTYGSTTKTNIARYDDKGNQIEYISRSFKFAYITKMKYDSLGIMTESGLFDTSGRQKCVIKYDDRGNPLESKEFKDDGSLSERISYRYDAKGNLIETNKFNAAGILSVQSIYRYKEDGAFLEMDFINRSGRLNRIAANTFNNKGLSIEYTAFNADSTISMKTSCKYDRWGNETELEIYHQGGGLKEKIKYEYKYDKNGNWIKKTVFGHDSKVYMIYKREIKYY